MSDNTSQDVRKGATEATKAANAQLLTSLPFEDQRDFEEAARGFVGLLANNGQIQVADGPDGEGGLALETPGGAQRMMFQNAGAAQ